MLEIQENDEILKFVAESGEDVECDIEPDDVRANAQNIINDGIIATVIEYTIDKQPAE